MLKFSTYRFSGLFVRLLRSEYAVDALRNTLAVVLPIILFFRWSMPDAAIGIGTGTLLISLTDLPGNRTDKFQSAWISIVVFALSALLTALSLSNIINTAICLLVLTFTLTMLGVFGSRIGLIGMMGIVIATFTLGLHPHSPFSYGLFVLIGGLWYYLVSLSQILVFPYRSLNRVLEDAENITSDLLRLRATGYDPEIPLSGFNERNIRLHLKLTAVHELIRQLLLGDRQAMHPKNNKGKLLLQRALNMIDLYEQVSAVHYDYSYLRNILAGTGALPLIARSIEMLSEMLVKNGDATAIETDFDHVLTELARTERQQEPSNAQIIRKITENLREIARLVSNIRRNELVLTDFGQSEDQYQDFLPRTPLTMKMIKGYLSFRSPIFRFALRLSALCLAAIAVIVFFPAERYTYWLLLTLVLVSRPSYFLTRKRNWERLWGTFIGLVIAWILVQFSISTALQLSLGAISLFGFFAFNRINYAVSVVFVTIAVVLCLNVYHGEPLHIVSGRIGFTALGCLLCLAATFLFPIWDTPKLKNLLMTVLSANREYLVSAIEERKQTGGVHRTRLGRKQAYQRLAALSEGLQVMKREPLGKKLDLSGVKHFELLSYQLNALIGSFIGDSRKGINLFSNAELDSILADLEYNILNFEVMFDDRSPRKRIQAPFNSNQPMDLVKVSGSLRQYFEL